MQYRCKELSIINKNPATKRNSEEKIFVKQSCNIKQSLPKCRSSLPKPLQRHDEHEDLDSLMGVEGKYIHDKETTKH